MRAGEAHLAAHMVDTQARAGPGGHPLATGSCTVSAAGSGPPAAAHEALLLVPPLPRPALQLLPCTMYPYTSDCTLMSDGTSWV